MWFTPSLHFYQNTLPFFFFSWWLWYYLQPWDVRKCGIDNQHVFNPSTNNVSGDKMLHPIVFRDFRKSHLLSDRKQLVKSVLSFAHEMLAWERVDISHPSDAWQRQRGEQFNTAASRSSLLQWRAKLAFHAALSLVCVSKEKGFAYQYQCSPRKMCK